MKKLFIGVFALVFALATGPAFAQTYEVDFNCDSSFETTYTISPGQTVDMCVHVTSLPEALVQDGCNIRFDNTLIDVTAVGVYDDGTGGSFSGAGPVATYTSEGGCWDKAQTGAVWLTAESLLMQVGVPTQCPSSGDDDLFLKVTLECQGAGTATLDIDNGGGATDTIGITGTLTVPAVAINVVQEVECVVDDDCPYYADGLFCTGTQTCMANACVPPTAGGPYNPCNDGDPCTVDECAEDTLGPICTYPCDEEGLSGPTDDCCLDGEACSATGSDPSAVCAAEVTLTKEKSYFSPTAETPITIKNRVCVDNPDDLIGGMQFDLCDEPNCMECIDCELTERTTMFDCVVLELEDGCCRVILFCKNPGCAINPGLCNVVTVVQQMKDPLPEECTADCIIETFENVVISDYDGYELAGAGLPGSVCPVVCGDVCPPGSGAANDCGDGIVDIYDIMCEVNFALGSVAPNLCQEARADVPTGTPPNCIDPDGVIDILDVMVLIDMALNRQDCCSFVYEGIIY